STAPRTGKPRWTPDSSTSPMRSTREIPSSRAPRDPESRADTARTAELLAQRLGVPVVPAYASAAAPTVPTVPEALRALAGRGRHRVAVASCFTAPGRFATECAAASPWITAAPLGTHPALARLLLHRYHQARTAPAPAPTSPAPA
ncbi:CbiX/SirB N-terminal domain-containing protein, partial [Streptomyces hirsutus]|uniref:CbiX/SirB N-terminal domain-containing protein n=1 Tax=Streptomyces hirsutus TaxID=35620 RepID=UPI003F4D1A55